MPNTTRPPLKLRSSLPKAVLIALLIIVAPSCNKTVSDISELNKWLNTPANGCIKSTSISGIKITAKYLPPVYSVLKDLNRNRVTDIDRAIEKHDSTIMFLLTIGVDEDKKGVVQPLMDANVDDYSRYTERVMETNFGMEKYLRLYINDIECHPIYAIVENVYEISDTRNFVVLFRNPKSNLNDKEWVLTYNDEFFNIGKVQAFFDTRDINRANEITINKNLKPS